MGYEYMEYLDHKSLSSLRAEFVQVYQRFLSVVQQGTVDVMVNPNIVITPKLRLKRGDVLDTELSENNLIGFFTDDFSPVADPEGIGSLPWDEFMRIIDLQREPNLRFAVPALILRLRQIVGQQM